MASKTYRQSKRTGKWSLEIRQNNKKIFYQGGFENKEKAERIAFEIFEKLDLRDDLQPKNLGIKGADITNESLISDITSLWVSEYIKDKKRSTINNYKQIERLAKEYFNIPVKNLTKDEFEARIQEVEKAGITPAITIKLRSTINRTLKYFDLK